MRLIDADNLVDMLYDNEFASLCPLDEVSGVIDAAPTVDAEVVVRCKDCKHSWEDISGLCCSYMVCVDLTVPDDFFCSYGERKEE